MVMTEGNAPGRRAVPTDPAPDAIDEELLARLRGGDDIAFRALVDRHRPWLVRLCTRLLGQDAHGAEDAAQESLLKLHTTVRRDGRPLRIRPWLAVVARNTCVDEQRRRRPDLPGDLPEQPAADGGAVDVDPALDCAWPRLSGRHREVLYLREVLGFSYKEIGAVMGLSGPAVETLLFRARASLRREYERAGGSVFGCGLLGVHLARLGLGRGGDSLPAREARLGVLRDGVPAATFGDGGLGGLGARLSQFATSLPGCGDQVVAKVLSVAAGVIMAVATVLPGLTPFSAAPPAAAEAPERSAGGPATIDAAAGPIAASPAPTARPASLREMLGSAAPANWAPRGTRTENDASSRAGSAGRGEASGLSRPPLAGPIPPVPAPERRVSGRSVPGPKAPSLRSILPVPAAPVSRPEPPERPGPHVLASLLTAPAMPVGELGAPSGPPALPARPAPHPVAPSASSREPALPAEPAPLPVEPAALPDPARPKPIGSAPLRFDRAGPPRPSADQRTPIRREQTGH